MGRQNTKPLRVDAPFLGVEWRDAMQTPRHMREGINVTLENGLIEPRDGLTLLKSGLKAVRPFCGEGVLPSGKKCVLMVGKTAAGVVWFEKWQVGRGD